MYLVSLDLHTAPGLASPITIQGLAPGLVMIVGPNASGKSTIGRTLRGTLWPSHAPLGVDARSAWRTTPEGPLLRATLVFGRAGWDADGVLLPAELAANSQLTLQDLLQATSQTDMAIARRIQTELNGGYDLSAIGPPAAPRTVPLPSRREPYRSASKSLSDLLDASDALSADEARLADLKVRQDEAAAAPARLEQVKRARRRLVVLGAIAQEEHALAELPAGLATLPSEAEATARDLQDEVGERRRRRFEAKTVRDAVQVEVDRLAFPRGAPEEPVVADLLARSEALVSEARNVQDAAKAVASAKGRVAELQRQVWADHPPTNLPDHRTLETLATAIEAVARDRARLQSLPDRQGPSEAVLADEEVQALFDARSMLRQWLAFPRQVVVATPARSFGLYVAGLVVLGLVLAALGLVLALVYLPWMGLPVLALGLGLVGAGVGIWLGPQLATSAPDAPTSDVEGIQRRYADRGYPKVGEWTITAVERVIDDIDQRLRDDIRRAQKREEAARVDSERTRLAHDLSEARAALAKTTEALGLSADLPELALPVQADRIRSLAVARADLADVWARHRQASTTQTGDEATVRESILSFGLDDLPPLNDATGLLSAARALKDRLQAWRTATDRLGAATRALTTADAELGRAERDRDKHLLACGVTLDEMHLLGEMDRKRAFWCAATDEKRRLEHELAGLLTGLPHDLPLTAAALEAEQARLEDSARQLASVSDEIGAIKNRIQTATEGRTIQDAVARRNGALDDLVADRDAHLVNHAGAALVAWLRHHRSGSDAPELLDRARRWFLRFTRNRYELLIGPNQSFMALDAHTSRRQSLGELSDGTRIQLLLAARLAFVEHIEKGGDKAPIFLDEVLSTADPQRFSAIATAILELAADGRQVFYATADAAEAHAWKRAAAEGGFTPPQVVTLESKLPEAEWSPPPTLPGLSPPVPAPDGRDAIGYAAALGLPRPHLHAHADTWPLTIALHDRLEAAHRAARDGLTRLGQLDLETSGIALPIDEADLVVARARRRAIRATLEALRVGRGRPVTWDDVARSNAVSEAFTERVQKLLVEHGSDPRVFINGVRTIPRFRGASVEQLVQYLDGAGVLDPQETLPRDKVIERAQQACREAIAAEALSLGEVAALTRMVIEVVRVEA